MSNRTGNIPSFRNDKLDLRSPRVLDDGTKVYTAVLARADSPLEYRWGTEYPTKEALSDTEYLEGLRGISFLERHPPSTKVARGRTPTQGRGRRMGTVITSRFDEATSEVIIEIAVPVPEDQEKIEAQLFEVSEGYDPQIHIDEAGVRWQIKRKPNHVAATDMGRANGARIQTDSEETDLEELMQMMKDMMSKLDGLESKWKSEEPVMNMDSKPLDELTHAVTEELGDKARNDSASFKSALKERIEREAKDMSSLLDKARQLEVSVKGSTAGELRKNLALALGADAARCDSADYCDGVISSREPNVASTVKSSVSSSYFI